MARFSAKVCTVFYTATRVYIYSVMVFKVVYGEISHIFLCLVRGCVSLHLCVWGYAQ